MTREGVEAVLRRLARDQWVRLHGTPRISVLVGERDARRWWDEWIKLSGLQGEFLEGELELDLVLRSAADRAIAEPQQPIGVRTTEDELAGWRRHRTDRLAAMVDEGTLVITSAPAAVVVFDARSQAEAALFDALEATAATAGRFEPNGKLSVVFGSQAAEVDLLSRGDGVAIEIDGYHHFTDPECYRRDRRKDLLLQTQGLFVIRLLAEDILRDARGSVQMVCQALAYRLGQRR